ncbi:class D sortase [Sediminibacillus massiliensis]|uniref:class D sortase n=1 Tax=Sediminibacillus massiliensis TaxID=1926277 RepID=UPI0009882EA1|nr:class D sortase [Sediminibacillus massiliensis]
MNRKKGRLIILGLSCLLVVAGLFFMTTNVYKFGKGYLIYKTGQVTAVEKQQAISHKQAMPVKQETVSEEKPEEQSESEQVYPEVPEQGDYMGDLIIPKLDAKLPIYHGTDEEELESGVGHYADSVLPGEADNSVLSGHRDTVFRNLGEVGKGDLLITRTAKGEFTYKVRKVRIVDKDDRTVIVPKPEATLTVTTCYPFEFAGDAPERYILVADLISAD